MVVGHTIQDAGINSACGGRVVRVDVGLSAGCGDGDPQVSKAPGLTCDKRAAGALRVLASAPPRAAATATLR